MTNNITALAFEDLSGAENMLENVHTWQDQGLLTLVDAVIVTRGVGNHVDVHQTHKSTGKYTLGGSGIGLLAGLLLGGPIGGIVVGAGVGAVTGALKDYGIDDKFINQAAEGMTSNSSMLFLMTEPGDTERLVEELRPHQAIVISTTLAPDQEKRLRAALNREE